jgi:hypothetical protein
MIDFKKLNKLSYMSKRMYILKRVSELKEIDLDYLFGLFNLYNIRNSGRWFWQKARFTGLIKDSFDKFNKALDETIKDLKYADEAKTKAQLESNAVLLDELLVGMETNCGVDRKKDFGFVKGNLGSNFRELINSSLKNINEITI